MNALCVCSVRFFNMYRGKSKGREWWSDAHRITLMCLVFTDIKMCFFLLCFICSDGYRSTYTHSSVTKQFLFFFFIFLLFMHSGITLKISLILFAMFCYHIWSDERSFTTSLILFLFVYSLEWEKKNHFHVIFKYVKCSMFPLLHYLWNTVFGD